MPLERFKKRLGAFFVLTLWGSSQTALKPLRDRVYCPLPFEQPLNCKTSGFHEQLI